MPWRTGERVVAPEATVEKLAGGFAFAEGPTCDPDGNVLFTDQPNDRILKWSTEGRLSTFLQPAGRANGMYFAPGGDLIACADEKTALWSIAPDGRTTALLDTYGSRALNGPNDVWVRPDGALYFTDPFYPRPWWTYDAMPQDGQHVYFLSADRRMASSARQTAGACSYRTSKRTRPTGTTSHLMGTCPARLSSSSRAPTG